MKWLVAWWCPLCRSLLLHPRGSLCATSDPEITCKRSYVFQEELPVIRNKKHCIATVFSLPNHRHDNVMWCSITLSTKKVVICFSSGGPPNFSNQERKNYYRPINVSVGGGGGGGGGVMFNVSSSENNINNNFWHRILNLITASKSITLAFLPFHTEVIIFCRHSQ